MHLLGIQGRLGMEVSSKTAKEIWVKGFLRLIGFTTSIISELWALKDGLSLAIQLGFYQLEVELNAMVIVDLINSDKNPNRDYSPLLYDCRSLLARLPQVRVSHVFVEANKCADLLVKRGCSMREDFVIFYFPSFYRICFLTCLGY